MPGDTPSSAILSRTPGGVALMTTPLFSARTLTGVSLLGCAGGGALACKCEAKRSKRIPLSERLRRVRIKCQDQSVPRKVCPLDVRIKVCTSWANFDPDTGYLDIWTYLVCTFRFVPPPPRFVTIDAAAFEVDKIRPDPIRAASCSHASECRLISR